MEDPPPEKRSKPDFGLCFRWQTKRLWDYKNYIKNPSIQAIGKLIITSSERCRYGESDFEFLSNQLHGASDNELLKNKISYHKNSYKNVTNNHSVYSVRGRYDKDLQEIIQLYVKRRLDDVLHVIQQ